MTHHLTDDRSLPAISRFARLALVFLFAASPIAAFAQDGLSDFTPPPVEQQHAAPVDDGSEIRPRTPEDPFWAGLMIIIVVGLFLAAAVVGPIVRSEMLEEPVDAHGHEDVHSDSHGAAHGHHHDH